MEKVALDFFFWPLFPRMDLQKKGGVETRQLSYYEAEYKKAVAIHRKFIHCLFVLATAIQQTISQHQMEKKVLDPCRTLVGIQKPQNYIRCVIDLDLGGCLRIKPTAERERKKSGKSHPHWIIQDTGCYESFLIPEKFSASSDEVSDNFLIFSKTKNSCFSSTNRL